MRKLLLLLLVSALALWAFKPTTTPLRLYVIGDSTASPYDGSRYPRMGWAQVLQDFFDQDSVFVLNRARSGRSSKSYYHEGAGWPAVKTALQAGDFLFIQFGHNDARQDDTTRFTEPFGSYQDYLGRYVNEARAMGVTPVLMTSIHRNAWTADTLSIDDTHGDYLTAVRQLADSLGVALIDMASLTDSLFEARGYSYTTEQIFLNLTDSLYRGYPTGNEDNTHLQETGAYELSELVSNALAASSDSSVQPLKAGLYDMVRVSFAVSPVGEGYVQGPRYVPVGVDRSVFARPGMATEYEFERWTIDGQPVETSTRYTFSRSLTDSGTVVAEFALPTSRLALPLPGFTLRTLPGQLQVESEAPLQTLRLIDQAGRVLAQQSLAGRRHAQVATGHLTPGVYYLHVQRSTDAGWRKVRLD